jgi:hypothetical protein
MYRFLLFALFLLPRFIFAQVVINEIMASNSKTISDEDGDASDWIELYNNGTESIDLSGFGLSDDSLIVQKWKCNDAAIEPGGYLVIFASGKDRQTSSLHTNFKINADGEPVLLADANGNVIDRINIPPALVDVSYGRTGDGMQSWIFQQPTPGYKNSGVIIEGFADSIFVSPRSGFYSSQVSVTLSAGDSRIFYTLDGSAPDTTATKYAAPIALQQTTVLKAMSVKANYLPTHPITHTYFVNESTDLPVISLSADPDDLFDPNSGIYPNFTMDWERPAHIEFYEDDKSPGFSKDCGINIVGNQSANWDQKSIAVKFKNEYGVSSIEYPLFPGFWVKKFDSFILRNSGNDWQYTHIRDAMMQTLVNDLDIDYQEYRPATTFINGEYWGIYNIREKISEHYVANRYGVDPDNIDMLENNMEVLHGDSLHYQKLIDFISTQDLSTTVAYDSLNSMIDLDECILYFAAQAYYDNMDWPGTNIRYWREKSASGKWRWILSGLDFGFGLYAHGAWEDHIQFMFSPVETRYSNPPWATLLQRKLVENPTIRNRFINQIADLLNTNFKSTRVVDIINTMANHIAGEITRHRQRWHLAGENTNKLITFAQDRPAYLRTHVRNYFNCGNDGRLTINASAGGRVKLNTLYLFPADLPWTGTYFQGNAVHLKAIADPGYKFDGWSGAVASGDASVTVNVASSTNVSASFSIDSGVAKEIVINEINYHSSDLFDSGDWIELYNQSDQSVNMSDWTFADRETDHIYSIPSGTVLESKKYLVLVENDSAFTARFPDVMNYLGGIGFGLSGSGESIKLMDEEGQVIDSLTYDDQSPWPAAADGTGATLELTDPALDNSKAENWAASTGYGSPGRLNTVLSAIDESKSKPIPQSYLLYQNYPNPFNSATRITYQVPEKCHVELSLFNTAGQLIETMVSENKAPGEYAILWEGKSVSSGIYFYKLVAGEYVSVKKMLSIK